MHHILNILQRFYQYTVSKKRKINTVNFKKTEKDKKESYLINKLLERKAKIANENYVFFEF